MFLHKKQLKCLMCNQLPHLNEKIDWRAANFQQKPNENIHECSMLNVRWSIGHLLIFYSFFFLSFHLDIGITTNSIELKRKRIEAIEKKRKSGRWSSIMNTDSSQLDTICVVYANGALHLLAAIASVYKLFWMAYEFL